MKLLLCSTCVVLTLLGAGCGFVRPSSADAPQVKPALALLTAEQAEARSRHPLHRTPCGLACVAVQPPAPERAAAVRAYAVGRTFDASDPNLLHEAHVVYRQEQAMGYDLAPIREKGAGARSGEPAAVNAVAQPLQSQELTTFLADQRRANEGNQQAIAALFRAVEALTRQQQSLLQREAERVRAAATAVPTEADAAAEPKPEERR